MIGRFLFWYVLLPVAWLSERLQLVVMYPILVLVCWLLRDGKDK